jgi:hypothetical protein
MDNAPKTKSSMAFMLALMLLFCGLPGMLQDVDALGAGEIYIAFNPTKNCSNPNPVQLSDMKVYRRFASSCVKISQITGRPGDSAIRHVLYYRVSAPNYNSLAIGSEGYYGCDRVIDGLGLVKSQTTDTCTGDDFVPFWSGNDGLFGFPGQCFGLTLGGSLHFSCVLPAGASEVSQAPSTASPYAVPSTAKPSSGPSFMPPTENPVFNSGTVETATVSMTVIVVMLLLLAAT